MRPQSFLQPALFTRRQVRRTFGGTLHAPPERGTHNPGLEFATGIAKQDAISRHVLKRTCPKCAKTGVTRHRARVSPSAPECTRSFRDAVPLRTASGPSTQPPRFQALPNVDRRCTGWNTRGPHSEAERYDAGRLPDRRLLHLVRQEAGPNLQGPHPRGVPRRARGCRMGDGAAIDFAWFGNCTMHMDRQANSRGQVCMAPLVGEGLFPERVPLVNVENACATTASALATATFAVRGGGLRSRPGDGSGEAHRAGDRPGPIRGI